MRELAVLTFQTLDGVMQAPKLPEEDPSGGFSHGGWAEPYWDDVMAQVGRTAMAAPYEPLLGRRTYDNFAAAFATPTQEGVEANMLTRAKKHVVTSSDAPLRWENSHQITGDIAAEIAALKREEGPLLQVHGSWRLIQLLLSERLVDELRLWTFPVVLGSGKRLFADGAPPTRFRLAKFDTCANGAFLNFWRPS